MAINQNHTFEELNGIKCAVVEKNVSPERVDFLKRVLKNNGYTVVVATPAPAKAAIQTEPVEAPVTPVPEVFTVGVTDVGFNAINAVFGRLLKTEDGRTVTLSYWQQKENESNDTIPYFQEK